MTVAGVSQESGLRTFRDAHTGIWAGHKPEDLASPEAFRKDPKLGRHWHTSRREAIKGAPSNPGHYEHAELACRLPEFILITQNVDGLHRLGGSLEVLELHGNIQRVRCSEGGKSAEDWQEKENELPRCASYGNLLRPHVVRFGEPPPRAEVH